jgi:hypothetical protein
MLWLIVVWARAKERKREESEERNSGEREAEKREFSPFQIEF